MSHDAGGHRPGLRPWSDGLARPFRPGLAAMRKGWWRTIWLGPAAAAIVTAGALLGRVFHPAILSYSADTSWPQASIRIPLSVAAPALHLPYWGAVLQVLVVLIFAQPVLGVRRVLGLGLVAHILATVAVRGLLEIRALPLPAGWRTELDSGPSVAVLAIGVACVVVARSRSMTALVIGSVAVEVALLHSLSSVEHVVGVTCGLLAGLMWRAPVRTVPPLRPNGDGSAGPGSAGRLEPLGGSGAAATERRAVPLTSR